MREGKIYFDTTASQWIVDTEYFIKKILDEEKIDYKDIVVKDVDYDVDVDDIASFIGETWFTVDGKEAYIAVLGTVYSYEVEAFGLGYDYYVEIEEYSLDI